MLYTIVIVLLALWLLGLVTSFTAGGLLHILLVVAVIVLVYQLVTGRRGV
ncbi:MAG: lmo0937 family membrane protein [Pseudomonadota bacterium]